MTLLLLLTTGTSQNNEVCLPEEQVRALFTDAMLLPDYIELDSLNKTQIEMLNSKHSIKDSLILTLNNQIAIKDSMIALEIEPEIDYKMYIITTLLGTLLGVFIK